MKINSTVINMSSLFPFAFACGLLLLPEGLARADFINDSVNFVARPLDWAGQQFANGASDHMAEQLKDVVESLQSALDHNIDGFMEQWNASLENAGSIAKDTVEYTFNQIDIRLQLLEEDLRDSMGAINEAQEQIHSAIVTFAHIEVPSSVIRMSIPLIMSVIVLLALAACFRIVTIVAASPDADGDIIKIIIRSVPPISAIGVIALAIGWPSLNFLSAKLDEAAFLLIDQHKKAGNEADQHGRYKDAMMEWKILENLGEDESFRFKRSTFLHAYLYKRPAAADTYYLHLQEMRKLLPRTGPIPGWASDRDQLIMLLFEITVYSDYGIGLYGRMPKSAFIQDASRVYREFTSECSNEQAPPSGFSSDLASMAAVVYARAILEDSSEPAIKRVTKSSAFLDNMLKCLPESTALHMLRLHIATTALDVWSFAPNYAARVVGPIEDIKRRAVDSGNFIRSTITLEKVAAKLISSSSGGRLIKEVQENVTQAMELEKHAAKEPEKIIEECINSPSFSGIQTTGPRRSDGCAQGMHKIRKPNAQYEPWEKKREAITKKQEEVGKSLKEAYRYFVNDAVSEVKRAGFSELYARVHARKLADSVKNTAAKKQNIVLNKERKERMMVFGPASVDVGRYFSNIYAACDAQSSGFTLLSIALQGDDLDKSAMYVCGKKIKINGEVLTGNYMRHIEFGEENEEGAG